MSDYFEDDENGHGDTVIEVRQSRGDVVLSVRLTAEEMDMLDAVAKDMETGDTEMARQILVDALQDRFDWIEYRTWEAERRTRPGLVTRR